MKKGWRTKKLGDLCEIELGKTPARANNSFWDEKRETSNVWLSIADLLNTEENIVVDSKEYLSDKGAAISKTVHKGTLLASFKLTLGRLAFAGRDLYTNEAIAALTIFNEHELSKEFLFYFLCFFDWRKAAENDVKLKGMTLNKAKLKELHVHFPSPSEQQRIVGILDEAFEGIATAKANAKKNLHNARAIFESHLQSVFAQRGEGWADSTLGDVLAVLRNGLNCKQDKSGNGTRISRIESIWNAEFDLRRVGYAELPEAQKNKFMLQKGDVLFSHINSAIHVGKTALFDLDKEVVHGVNLLLMRPKSTVLPAYLDLYMKLIFAQGYWWRVCKQSINQASVNQQDINRVPIRFPGLKAQGSIVDQMDGLAAETQRLESIYHQKLAALEALKKSLLHKAFAGEL